MANPRRKNETSPIKAWVIVFGDGAINPNFLGPTRKDVIRDFVQATRTPWGEWDAEGYRTLRVVVSPATPADGRGE